MVRVPAGKRVLCMGSMPFPRALLALEKPNSLVEAALATNAELFGATWDI